MRIRLPYIGLLLVLFPLVSAAKAMDSRYRSHAFTAPLDTMLFASLNDTTRTRPQTDPREEDKRIKEVARPKRQTKPEKVDEPQDPRQGNFRPRTSGPEVPFPNTRPGNEPSRRPAMDPSSRPGTSRPSSPNPSPGRRP